MVNIEASCMKGQVSSFIIFFYYPKIIYDSILSKKAI